MNEKELTNKEKVEKLKQNSRAALDEKRRQIIENPSPILETQKRNKRGKNSTNQEKNPIFSFQKRFASFSTSFTEKDLLLQVCIVVPIVLLLLLICKQVLFKS